MMNDCPPSAGARIVRRESSLTDRGFPRALLLATAWGIAAATSFAAAPAPHTAAPFNNAPGTFRFALLPDRTGGNRPGPFEDAVRKLQWLQPEFVMSVGDLIDGYTTDPKIWEAQWEEFDRTIEQLGLRFHYVPGNHDISNQPLLDAWKRRHGTPWSSFVYQNVLFLILHTEDVLAGEGGLGPEQIAWVKATLARHPEVRWTLLFFHRPLWLEKNQRGFEQVTAALQGRPYTVFAGHHHTYLKSEHAGATHYVLATAGGSSELRGSSFGEFDHVTWVTMKPDGPPIVANLELSGILPDDIVTQETLSRVRALRDGSWLRVRPIVAKSDAFEKITATLELSNPTEHPLRINGTLPPRKGVAFSPAQLDRTLAPGQTEPVSLELSSDRPGGITVNELNESALTLTLNGSYEVAGKTLSLPASQRVRADRQHPVTRGTGAVALGDHSLADWPDNLFTDITQPMLVREEWDWKGPDDGRFRFAVQQRYGSIFVAIRTFDDQVSTAKDPTALQDKLMVEFRTAAGSTTLTGVAGTNTSTVNVRAVSGGLEGEFMLFLPAGTRTFHLNVAWQDHDRTDHTKPSVLWWRDPAVPEFGEFGLAP